MQRRTLSFPLAFVLPLTLLAPVACIEEDEDIDAADAADDEVDVRSGLVGGIKLNSGLVGGIKLNTDTLAQDKLLTLTNPNLAGTVHGHRLRTVTFAGTHANKTWNNVVYLSDQATGRLAFKTTQGATLSGADLEGAVLGFDTNGDNIADLDVKLSGETLQPNNTATGGPLYYYAVHTRATGSGAAWQNLCSGEESGAIFVDGDWREQPIDRLSSRGDSTDGNDTISLACTDGAIYKCTIQGKRATDAASEDRHETCVRAFTAAYGGDARTTSGMPIDVHEAEGATPRFAMESNEIPAGGDLVKEAEWGKEGALCVNRQALRFPASIDGCPGDRNARTVSNCVVRDANGNDIPECNSNNDYSLTFEYGAALMTTYASQSASQTGYDPVRDVHWGVATNANEVSTLTKGIVTAELQALTVVGPVQEYVNNGDGTYSLASVRIDGLVYSDVHGSLMGFQVNNATLKSRLVRIRPNGLIHSTGAWFEGRVRGADISRNGKYILAATRDRFGSHNRMLTVDPNSGDLLDARGIVRWNTSTLSFVEVEVNEADIARRTRSGAREWYFTTNNDLYSFSNATAMIGNLPYIVLDPKLQSYANYSGAGMAFAHPDNLDQDPDNDRMVVFDIADTDRVRRIILGGSYAAATLASSPFNWNSVSGDLAAFIPHD